MALTDTALRNAKAKDKAYKLYDENTHLHMGQLFKVLIIQNVTVALAMFLVQVNAISKVVFNGLASKVDENRIMRSVRARGAKLSPAHE